MHSEKTRLKKCMMIMIIIIITEKIFTKKGDVGMAKCFSKSTETRDELLTICNPMSRCLSVPDTTSLPPEPSSILYYLKLNSDTGTK